MSGSGRIRDRLSRPMFLLSVIAAAVGALGVWIWMCRGESSIPAADDPTCLKLLYVRPDCGRQVYDAAGVPLGEVPSTAMRAHWEASSLVREFVFECRVKGEHPIFPRHMWLSLDEGIWRGVAWYKSIESADGWHTLHCEAIVPRTVRRSAFTFGPIRVPRSAVSVHTVDARIWYFAGPRGQARATFVGPFDIGRTYRAAEDDAVVLQSSASGTSGIRLRLTGPSPVEADAPIIVYRRDGRRLLLESRSGSTSPGGFDWTVETLDIAPADIECITIGETPQQQIFRNIVVAYPDQPVRTYPQSLDEIIARLDLDTDLKSPGASESFVQNRSFLKTPSQALRILDIAQGPLLAYAIETLQAGSVEDLSQAERERLESILGTWFETGRQIEACHLGLWAQWPRFTDTIPSLLRSGDLTGEPLRHLAVEWGRKAPAEPNTVAAMTDLLIDRDIVDSSIGEMLVYAIRRGAQNNGTHIQRLAECDKPWIWERVIRPDGLFEQWKQDRLLSDTVRARIVALGMDDSVDDARSLEPQAETVLCSMLTPKYVQIGNVHDWFGRFERQVGSERGTDVLVGYLKAQLQQWDTWQLPGRTSRNPYGVRLAVQLLNRWHGTNLGGLGSDSGRYANSDYRFNWQDIAREALYWARTGEEPRKLPPDWRASPDDLRVVWFNRTSPELSVIAVWPARRDPNLPPTDTVLEVVDDFLQFNIAPSPSTCQFVFRAGVVSRHSMGRNLTFAPAELPRKFDPGPTNMSGTGADGVAHETPLWNGSWEIWIERAAAEESVLEDTTLFAVWKEQYLTPGPPSRPQVFQIGTEEAQLQYIFNRRDYTGMSEVEIALRQAMDWDPELPSDELKDYKDKMSRPAAVKRYQELLQRGDLPIEAQIFIWSRIADLSLHRGHPENPDPASNAETARYAFERAMTLDPNWVSPTTFNLQRRRGDFGDRRGDQIGYVLDAYEWLLTRTPAMIEASVRRPRISRFGADSRSMLPPVPEAQIEQAETDLVAQLSRNIKSMRQMIDAFLIPAGRISDTHQGRWERLRAIDEKHWSHTYRGSQNSGSQR